MSVKIFRSEFNSDVKILDIVKYSLDFLRDHPGAKIYVGTDSQNHRRKTWYVTAIAFRYGTRGVHVIYYREKINKIRDMFTRLWKECEMSIEIAEHLRKNGVLVHRIDLDYNEDDSHDSNRLISAGKGYVIGLGYDCATKPSELVATRAADHLCR